MQLEFYYLNLPNSACWQCSCLSADSTMTTTVGAFNLKSLLSLCCYVVQVFDSILFFNKLLQTCSPQRHEDRKYIIIVISNSLVCKKKNAAVNCHELTQMLHHVRTVLHYHYGTSHEPTALNSSIADVHNA